MQAHISLSGLASAHSATAHFNSESKLLRQPDTVGDTRRVMLRMKENSALSLDLFPYLLFHLLF